MQTIEMYINDTIAKYSLFKQAATQLIQEIPSLQPRDILHRCEDLTSQHKKIDQDKEQLFIRIEFMGPSILDTSYIGEFQRALDKTILACDLLHTEIAIYRESLASRPG